MFRSGAARWIPLVAMGAASLYVAAYFYRWSRTTPLAVLLAGALLVPLVHGTFHLGAERRRAVRAAAPFVAAFVFAFPTWNVVANVYIATFGRPLPMWLPPLLVWPLAAMALAYMAPFSAALRARLRPALDTLDGSLLASAIWFLATSVISRLSSEAQHFHGASRPIGLAFAGLAIASASASVILGGLRWRWAARAFAGSSPDLKVVAYEPQAHGDVPFLSEPGDAVIVGGRASGERPYRSAEMGVPLARTSFDRRAAIGPLARRTCAAVLVLAVSAGSMPLVAGPAPAVAHLAAEDARRGPEFHGLRQPCDAHGRVYFAPIGPSTRDLDVRAIARRYEDGWSHGGTQPPPGVLPAFEPPAWAFDQSREQLIAEDVLFAMRAFYAGSVPDDAVVIGLTDRDMYSKQRDWRYVFSLRSAPFAVVSSARMGSDFADGPGPGGVSDARFYKVITRSIAILYCGRTTTPDRRSVLFENVLGPADLDRMDESLW